MVNDMILDIFLKYGNLFKSESHRKIFLKRIIEGQPLSKISKDLSTSRQNVSKIILNYIRLICENCTLSEKIIIENRVAELSKGKNEKRA